MSRLEDAIREVTKSGRLHGLTLFPSRNGSGAWQGNARWEGNAGWTVVIDDDPVAALTGALTGKSNFDPANPVGVKPAPAAPKATDNEDIFG